eukprot:1208547-Prymnesium_polylepis.1
MEGRVGKAKGDPLIAAPHCALQRATATRPEPRNAPRGPAAAPCSVFPPPPPAATCAAWRRRRGAALPTPA